MERTVSNPSSIPKLLPGLALWMRLPALIGWSAVSCGILIAFYLPLPKFLLTPALFYIIYSAVATISLLFAIICKNNLVRFTGFFLFTVALCICRENRKETVSQLLKNNSDPKTTHSIHGSIVSSPVSTPYGYKFLIRAGSVSFDTAGILKSRLFLCLSPFSPPCSEEICVIGRCKEAKQRQNRYDFDEYTFLISNGIWGKMDVDSVEVISTETKGLKSIGMHFREMVLTVLDSFLNPSHRAILQAAFLGEKDYLPSDIKNSFRKSGIYHLLAISGLHAGMLITATYLLLSLFPLSNNTKHLLSIAILWLYLLFIGFLPSLFRATVMATLIIASLLFQRKNYPLQSLGLAGILWLILSPESLFLPGYQLSFSATFGIITLPPVFNRLRPKISNPVLNYLFSKIFSAFTISFSGFLSTAPVLLYHFGTISIFGLVANLVAVMLMTFCMWSFFISLLLNAILPYLSILPVKISALMLSTLIAIAHLALKIKWSELTLPVPYPEIILFYSFFLAGLATIAGKLIKSYLKWGIPVLMIIIPVSFLLRSNQNDFRILPFTGNNLTATAVQWPHKGVWVFCKGKKRSVNSFYKYSLKPWLRHNPGLYLEEIYLLKASGNELISVTEEFNSQNDFPLKQNHIKKTFHDLLFKPIPLSICSLAGEKIVISSLATWVSFSPGDTFCTSGTLNKTDKMRINIPGTIHVKNSNIKNSCDTMDFMYLHNRQALLYGTKNKKME